MVQRGTARTRHAWRHGQQRAQDPAVNGGHEQVHDRRPVAVATLAAVHDAPPEERRGTEETEMLDDVHGLMLECLCRTAPERARSRARGHRA